MLAAMTSMASGNTGEAAVQAIGQSLQNPPSLSANGTGVLSAFIAAQAAVGTTDALLLAGVAAATTILLLIGAVTRTDAFRGELARAGPAAGHRPDRVAGARRDGGGGRAGHLAVGVARRRGGAGRGRHDKLGAGRDRRGDRADRPALLAASEHRGLRIAGRDRPTELTVPRRSARRLVIESTATRGDRRRRGRAAGPSPRARSGVDPYLVAAPVLIAIAAVLIAARVYPVPLRAVAPVTAARRGTVGSSESPARHGPGRFRCCPRSRWWSPWP